MKNWEKLISKIIADDALTININTARMRRFHEGFQFKSHKHREHEVIYVNSGCCTLDIEGTLVSLKKDDAIVINPGHSHNFMVDMRKGCRITQVEFQVEGISEEELKLSFFERDAAYYTINDAVELCRIMESICQYNYQCEKDTIYYPLIRYAFAQLILLCSFYREQRKNVTNYHDDKVDGVISYIESHYTDNLDMEEVALKYRVSSRYIRREMMKRKGLSCSEYITMLRVARAKRLLRDTKYSITEVALQSGFSSAQYFCRIFSKSAGMTPTNFRYLSRKGE